MGGRRDVGVEALFSVKGYSAADGHFGIRMIEMEMEVELDGEKGLEFEAGGGR